MFLELVNKGLVPVLQLPAAQCPLFGQRFLEPFPQLLLKGVNPLVPLLGRHVEMLDTDHRHHGVGPHYDND